MLLVTTCVVTIDTEKCRVMLTPTRIRARGALLLCHVLRDTIGLFLFRGVIGGLY
jgi:hypothetical protein